MPLSFLPAWLILAQYGVGYVDQAGNCRVRSARHQLLIDVVGTGRHAAPKARDCSRPSRAASSPAQPTVKGWKVRELANQADVEDSVGLAAKVKQTLSRKATRSSMIACSISAIRLACWRPGLSENRGPADQISLYFRGDQEAAEQAVDDWCRSHASIMRWPACRPLGDWRRRCDIT